VGVACLSVAPVWCLLAGLAAKELDLLLFTWCAYRAASRIWTSEYDIHVFVLASKPCLPHLRRQTLSYSTSQRTYVHMPFSIAPLCGFGSRTLLLTCRCFPTTRTYWGLRRLSISYPALGYGDH
jgi:hypothetical protein